jgi:hypothetical protein
MQACLLVGGGPWEVVSAARPFSFNLKNVSDFFSPHAFSPAIAQQTTKNSESVAAVNKNHWRKAVQKKLCTTYIHTHGMI